MPAESTPTGTTPAIAMDEDIQCTVYYIGLFLAAKCY